MLFPLLLLSLASLLVPPCIARSQEAYSESLRLTPLGDGKVHSNLSFTMSGPWNDVQQMGKSATGELTCSATTRLQTRADHFVEQRNTTRTSPQLSPRSSLITASLPFTSPSHLVAGHPIGQLQTHQPAVSSLSLGSSSMRRRMRPLRRRDGTNSRAD